MQTLDLERRRYRRCVRHAPVHVEGGGRVGSLAGESLDLSTGGAAVEVLGEAVACTVGDTVQIEIDLGDTPGAFATRGTVRHVEPVPAPDGAPARMRLGLQFREALLLSRCEPLAA